MEEQKMAEPKFSWKFPHNKLFFMRIETIFVLILAALILLFSWRLGWMMAILLTLLFVGLYALISYIIQRFRQAEEHYHFTPQHVHIVKKTSKTQHEEKIPLNQLHHHKVDKLLLGGYLMTKKKKKHLLFFNTRKELDKFENFLETHLYSKRKK